MMIIGNSGLIVKSVSVLSILLFRAKCFPFFSSRLISRVKFIGCSDSSFTEILYFSGPKRCCIFVSGRYASAKSCPYRSFVEEVKICGVAKTRFIFQIFFKFSFLSFFFLLYITLPVLCFLNFFFKLFPNELPILFSLSFSLLS